MSKKYKIFRLVMMVVLLGLAAFTTTSLILERTNQSQVDKPDVQDPVVLSKANYSLDDNYNIPVEWMKFEYLSASNSYAFVGFEPSYLTQKIFPQGQEVNVTMSYHNGKSTLRIPETYNGKSVTEVRRIVDYTTDPKNPVNHANDYYAYNGFITAIVIPKSVRKIEAAAFYGYTSLEYLEVPFIGTTRGVTTKESLASMFSPAASSSAISGGADHILARSFLVGSGEIEPYLPHDEENNILAEQKTVGSFTSYYLYQKRIAKWYPDSDTNQVKRYYMPDFLKRVVVTDDTELSDRAFFNQETLESIELSNTIQTLKGLYIFSGCKNLKQVVLPDTAGNLGKGLFSDCPELVECKLPDLVRQIPFGAFAYCYKLKTVWIPSSVEEFEQGCFIDCESLASMIIFNGSGNAKNIISSPIDKDGNHGFNITNNTTRIDAEAFRGCKQFKTIDLSQGADVVYDEVNDVYVGMAVSLEHIGAGAFNGCVSLETLTIPFVGSSKGNTGKEACFGYIFGEESTSNGNLGNGPSGGNNSGSGMTDDSILNPPDISASIAASSYIAKQKFGNGAADVASFRIPNSLKNVIVKTETVIAQGSFSNLCDSVNNTGAGLETLELSNTVRGISNGFLSGSSELNSLTTPFVNSQRLAFFFGTGLGSTAGFYDVNGYNVPTKFATVKITNQAAIGAGCFHNFTSLETVEIGKRTTWMDDNIFYNNNKLTNLIIPFVGCERGSWYRSWWWWRDNTWRNTVMWLFSQTKSSSYEYRNESQRYYEGYMRWIPYSLEYLEVTDETYIDTWAFRDFISLKEIKISNIPGSIAEYCMIGCRGLEKVTLPYIGEHPNAQAVNAANFCFGWVFGRSGYAGSYAASSMGYGTFYIPNGLKQVTIGASTKSISIGAFANCNTLESITLNGNITSLGNYAYYNCIKLTELSCPKASYTTVGNYAFANCQMVDTLYDPEHIDESFIPNTVTAIGHYAFYGTAVKNINENLKSYNYIGNYAFANCPNITYVKIPNNVAYLGHHAFADCAYLETADLSTGKVSEYLFAGCTSLRNCNLHSITKNIPAGMFAKCTSLFNGSVNGSDYIGFIMDPETETIGDYAFYGCSGLTDMEFSNSLTSIGVGAFQYCTGLKNMTIPKSVQVIAEDGFWNCRKTFFFWVYNSQEEWPKTWVNNWNCDYEVRILGNTDTSVFEFEFDIDTRKYILTGVKPGVTLTGMVTLPATRNGIEVTSIREGALVGQTGITSIIVPSTIKKFGLNALGKQYPKELTIYSELTIAEAIAAGLHDPDDELQNTNFEKNWVSTNDLVIYYHDYWQYGTTGNSRYLPYLDLSKFMMELDELESFTYDGHTAHKATVELIYTPGFMRKSNASENENDPFGLLDFPLLYDRLDSNTDIFDFEYSNNISAGTAYVYAYINSKKLEIFNNRRARQGLDPLRFINRATTTFKIEKKTLRLFYVGNGVKWEFTKPYDAEVWTWDEWDEGNVYGLARTPFVFTGTLATAKADAGKYLVSSQFKWIVPWRVYNTQGNNVSANFNVVLQDLLVDIKPREIYIDWQGGTWSGDGQYLLYPYIGDVVKPTAIPRAVNNNSDLSAICGLTVSYVSENSNEWPYYPSYDKVNQKPLIIGGNECPPHPAYAQIQDKYVNNFILCDARNKYEPIAPDPQSNFIRDVVNIHVVKGTIKIKINIGDYLIPENDDYWHNSNWNASNPPRGISILGLGNNSVITGDLRTKGQAIPDSLYSSLNDQFEWIEFVYKNKTVSYTIVNSVKNEDEMTYYDLEYDARVTIKFNTFNVKYYIEETTSISSSPISDVAGSNAAGNPVRSYTYVTEGKYHYFIADAINTTKESILYTYYDDDNINRVNVTDPREFIDPEKIYGINIQLNSKNFYPTTINFELNVIKSDVKIKKLDKEYDRKPAVNMSDISSVVENWAHVEPEYYDVDKAGNNLAQAQHDSLTFVFYKQDGFDYNNPSNNTPIANPTEIGKYIVHQTCDASRFYNELDKYVPFEISKRSIYIDLSAGPGGSFKYFDGDIYSFAPEPTEQKIIDGEFYDGCILTGDMFWGEIGTISSSVRTYAATMTDWVWIVPWSVRDKATLKDLSEYYRIVLQNSFEIRYLEMNVTADGFTGIYDATSHSITITSVTDKDNGFDLSGYTVYYSLVEMSEALDTPARSGYWSQVNPSFIVPGRYQVWYKVVCEHYKNFYGYAWVIINQDTIRYDLPFEDVPGNPAARHASFDGLDKVFVLTNVHPAYARVEYYCYGFTNGWTTVPPVFVGAPGERLVYDIQIRISAANYVTVNTTYHLIIDEENLNTIAEEDVIVNNVDTVYDGNVHYLSVQLSQTFLETYNLTDDDYMIQYSVDPANNLWTTNYIPFVSTGLYNVFYRIIVPGFKTYGCLLDKVGTVRIRPKGWPGGGGGSGSGPVGPDPDDDDPTPAPPGDGPGIFGGGGVPVDPITGEPTVPLEDGDVRIGNYLGEFDKLPHTVSIVGLSSHVFDEVRDYITISYTDNYEAYAYQLDSGWQTTPIYFTNVGKYRVYARLDIPNYQTLFLYGIVQITQATLDAELLSTEVEYNWHGIDNADILYKMKENAEGEFIYDGLPTYTYYKVVETSPGNFEKTSTRVNPLARGHYYVVVNFPETPNCKPDMIQGLFEIVPKKLTVIGDREVEYNGFVQVPDVDNLVDPDQLADLPFIPQFDWIVQDMPAGETGMTYPVELGTYRFDIFLRNGDGNYVLDRDYVDITIGPRNVLIYLREEMLYNDDNPQPWYKNSEWDDCYSQGAFMPNHEMYLEMMTSTYVRGTYYLNTVNPEDVPVTANRIWWAPAIPPVTDTETGKDYTEYYNIQFDVIVKIVYPSIEDFVIPEQVYIYDGERHGIVVDVPNKYETADVLFTETIADDESWTFASPKYVECGTYPVYVQVHHHNYEPYIQLVNIVIKPADLWVELEQVDITYDAMQHTIEYQVLGSKYVDENNIVQTQEIEKFRTIKASFIKYYSADKYTYKELRDLYNSPSFSTSSSIYQEGMDSVKNAGRYLAVVYFTGGGNWNACGEVGFITIKRRDVWFLHQEPYSASIDYDGYKKFMVISGMSLMSQAQYEPLLANPDDVDITGILSFHTLQEPYSASYIQTNSANAGTYYGMTDFEFGPLAYLIDNYTNENVASNYRPVIYVPNGDFKIIINKVRIDFTVDSLERPYRATSDPVTGVKMPEIATPILNTPDKYNPDIFFDNKAVLTFFKAYDNATPDNLLYNPVVLGYSTDADYLKFANVGRYVVRVQFLEGTNYLAYEEEDKMALVEITPREISVIWSNYEQPFKNKELNPTAQYETIFGTLEDLNVYYYDENFDIVYSQINAGYYEAFTQLPTNTNGVTNYVISDESYQHYFRIAPVTYQIEVFGSTYNVDAAWSTVINDEDIEDLIPGVHLYNQGGGEPGARVYTSNSVPGTYTTVNDFVVYYSVLNDKGQDISGSVKLVVTGKVTILSDDIVYRVKNFEGDDALLYRTQGYGIFDADVNALILLNPASKDATGFTIQYFVDGDIVGTTSEPRVYEVGIHTIRILMNYTNKKQAEETIIIEIVPRRAKFESTNRLGKIYDGMPVIDLLRNDNYTVSCNLTEEGQGNPQVDLVFKYYICDENYSILSDTPICIVEYGHTTGEKPIDAGYYKVVITSKADDVESNFYNYTALEEEINFEIKKRTLKLDIFQEEEPTTAAELEKPVYFDSTGKDYSQEAIPTTSYDTLGYDYNFDGLVASDGLKYVIKSVLDDGSYTPLPKVRGKYQFAELFECITDPNSSGSATPVRLPSTFGQMGNGVLAIYWNVQSRDRKDADDNFIDVSQNYMIDLDLYLYIHFPFLDAYVEDVSVTYSGQPVHGTLTINMDNITIQDLNQQYYYIDANGDETIPCTSIGDADVCRTEIGVYTIYYHLEVKGEVGLYEPVDSHYTITINKMARIIDTSVDPGLTKQYDGKPAGTFENSSKKYLPNFGFLYDEDLFGLNWETYEQADYEATHDARYFTISYSGEGYNERLETVTDYGFYEYTLIIPESDYFAETIIKGEFEIYKALIYVTGEFKVGYNGSSQYYNFATSNSHEIYTIETLEGSDKPVPVKAEDMYVTGRVHTSSGNIEKYTTNDRTNTLIEIKDKNSKDKIRVFYEGEDLTFNYLIQLGGSTDSDPIIKPFTIEIVKGKMSVEIPESDELTFPYDGDYHQAFVRMHTPGRAKKITYSSMDIPNIIATGKDQFTKDELEDGLATPDFFQSFRDDPIQEIELGEYVTWMRIEADNFEDVYARVVFRVVKATTKVWFENRNNPSRPLDQPYSGDVLDTRAYAKTNNIEATDILAWDVEYRQWDEANQEYFDMDDRPINAGKYMVTITVPETARFTRGSVTQEFVIAQLELSISWEKDTTYNGKPNNYPKYKVNGLAQGDKLEDLNITPSFQVLVPGDNRIQNVGGYVVTLSLTTNGNYFYNPKDLVHEYAILPKYTKVKLVTNLTYTGDVFEFYNRASVSDPSLYTYQIPSEFALLPGHSTSSDSILQSTFSDLGIYEGFDDNFIWLNAKNSLIIQDAANLEDVTSNYIIDYEIYAEVNYGSVSWEAYFDGLELFSSDQGSIYYDHEFDNREHFVQIQVKGANASTYTVKYSTTRYNDNYTTMPINNIKAVNTYYIYFYIYQGDTIRNDISNLKDCRVRVDVLPQETEIVLSDPNYSLSKVYDDERVSLAPIKNLVGLQDAGFGLVNFTYTFYNSVNGEKGSMLVNAPKNVGSYILVIDRDDSDSSNNDYLYDPLEIPFEITPRDLQITIVGTHTKVYDGLIWKYELDSALPTANYNGLLPGHILTGYIETESGNAGIYSTENFKDPIESGTIEIRNTTVEVTSNYNIIVSCTVKITKKDIEYSAQDVHGYYASGRMYSINVVVADPTTYDEKFDDIDDYIIEYTITPDDPASWSIENPEFGGSRMTQEVYFRIRVNGDNYNNVQDSRKVYISGLTYGEDIDDERLGLQYEPTYEYTGSPYPRPEFTQVPDEKEDLRYYVAVLDANGDIEMDATGKPVLREIFYEPTNVGTYYFTIGVTDYSNVDDFVTEPFSFEITKRNVAVHWEDLRVEWTGEKQQPNAYYEDVNGTRVDLVVVIDGKTEGVADLGSYPATLKPITDNNYKLAENTTETFVIFAQDVPDDIVQHMVQYFSDPNMQLSFEYLQEIVIYDDMYIYELDADGTILRILDVNNPTTVVFDQPQLGFKFIIDPDKNADKVANITKNYHTLTIRLDDPENTAWKTTQTSDDIEIKYHITPYKFDASFKHKVPDSIYAPSNSTEYDTHVIISLDRNFEIYTGSAITPKITVSVYPIDITVPVEGFPKELQQVAAGSGYTECIVDYSNNIEVGTAYALAYGVKNFAFDDLITEFQIILESPKYITFTPDAKIMAMYATIDEYKKLKIIEEFTGETEAIYNPATQKYEKFACESYDVYHEDTDSYETITIEEKHTCFAENFYLGHIAPETPIRTILKQILNDPKLTVVKDQNGKMIIDDTDEDGYKKFDITYFGNGYSIELYSKEDFDEIQYRIEHRTSPDEEVTTDGLTPVDALTGIVFGDLDSDGAILPADYAIMKKLLAGTEEYSDLIYFACLLDRQFDFILPNIANTLKKFLQDSSDENNFNLGYEYDNPYEI